MADRGRACGERVAAVAAQTDTSAPPLACVWVRTIHRDLADLGVEQDDGARDGSAGAPGEDHDGCGLAVGPPRVD